MRIVDQDGNDLENPDLALGALTQVNIVRKDAAPIDDVTKFAWADEDWEPVMVYVPHPPEKLAEWAASEREAAKAAEVPERLSALEASTDDVLLLMADVIGGAL